MADATSVMRVQNGRVTWTCGGQLHRTDGPAVVTCHGQREWWVRGRRHRTDGPAIERPNGDHEWFHEGYKMFETDFRLYMQLLRGKAS